MTHLPKSYDPKLVEEKWYKFWEENGYFKPDSSSKKAPYCVVIPPPNVTGVLHMGHALVDTIQDVLIRWKRMDGFETLWIPGTDHAGIATQTVVERHLIATESKRRGDFTREEFLSRVWQWKEESENKIVSQLKKLGCSCDWSSFCFTMDDKRSRSVRTIFKKMYDDGLIYRGDYLVNWDPVTETALADDEVEYEEKASFLWYIKYPLQDLNEFVVVATTRPETLLGDTAIAVSSNDERYAHLIGKNVLLPLTDRVIPIISDSCIDKEFGTGAVKVTPAHDPNDYEMGKRHGLDFINIMTPDGKINENGGSFQGLLMEEARKAVVEKLQGLGLVEKIVPHTHRVGISYRSKALIQPYLSKQWFVALSKFKSDLINVVKDETVQLIPSSFNSTYFHWIENLRDWCISRQLWWGHRIPIWYNTLDPSRIICWEHDGLPQEVINNPDSWRQDEDVLDTWFSSALWPFSTLGWPDSTENLKKFYPNATLVTGHDILFFWVARMLMMGKYVFNEAPFPKVFLHGLIYGKSYWRTNQEGMASYLSTKEREPYERGEQVPKDVYSKWEKMSKSKGNIIDPLEIIDNFGTDAMRMALCASATHARQIDLDRRRFEEFKNFANKIWNGTRFVLMNLEDLDLSSGLDFDILQLEDRWILSKLNRIIGDVNKHLNDYAFDKAALESYDFFWKEFCAYYLEITKPVLFGKIGTPEDKTNKQKILLIVLCNAVRLLHPMAPFITEEIFQSIKQIISVSHLDYDVYLKETLTALKSSACIKAPFPHVLCEKDINPDVEKMFNCVDSVLYTIRTIRAEMQLAPSVPSNVHIVGEKEARASLEKHQNIFRSLIRIDEMHFHSEDPVFNLASTAFAGDFKIIIPLPDEMRQKESARLLKEQEKLLGQQESLARQLSNTEFMAKAPKQLVEKLQKNAESTEAELLEIIQKLKSLS